MIANISLPEVGGFITSFIRRNKVDLAVPPRLDSAVRRPHGPFHFQFTMTRGCPFEVQVSSDLKNWAAIADGTFDGERMDYVDSEASRYNHRYYRVYSGKLPSTSILGYASVSVPPKFSMISNPFDAVSNSVGSLLSHMPNGTYVSKYDSSQCRLTKNLLENGRWANSQELLKPGEGAIIFNPTDEFKTINFFGTVMYDTSLFNPIPAGFSIRSSLMPQSGRLDTDLEFPMNEGDSIHLFNRDRQEYEIYDYPSKEWQRNPPVIGIGESFWVAKNSPGNWTRSFAIPT